MAKRYTQEWKDNISRSVRKKWKDPKYRNRILLEETRQKLSEAAKKGNKNRKYKLKPIGELKSSGQVRTRLIRERGEACEECGWNQKNIFHNIISVQVHHIDGDSQNNNEENLKILCPNCHSLTEFFMCYGRKPSSPNSRTLKRYESWKNKV